MSLFESLKTLFWQLPLLSDAEKQEIFYYLKGKIKGEAKGGYSDDVLCQYVAELLATQDFSNSFSINYPKFPQLNIQKEDPKLIAYYLPQYYPDSHNEKWWGRGSTEWTNVTKSYPQYVGQYQPRLPGELGFYDLRIKDNLYRQIELAHFYGIYGFSFYYYWFDGERLLDLPFNEFINDKTIHFPFNICWVNETWTKQWEGSSNVPLMVQNKSIESYKNFIKSCVEVFTHDNYICINGKPVLTVYRPLDVPQPHEVLDYWRQYIYKKTGLELYIIGDIRSDKEEEYNADYKSLGFDAVAEFAPGPQLRMMKVITKDKQYVCDKFLGKVYDYREFVENKRYFQLKKQGLYRAISPLWDNTARKKNRGLILDGSTPDLYKQWLIDIIKETKNNDTIDDKMIFINAWNEWAEGAYLEPDLKWKYGYLEATRDAILEARHEESEIGEKLMINKKKVGIVILNYNDAASTLHILKQIKNYSAIDHIVIVDNLSPDGSFQQLKSMAGDKVDVIQSDKNGGYSYGNNYGAFYLIDKYMVDILVIANPDVEFSEAFLIQIVQDMVSLNVQAASGYMDMPADPSFARNRKINSYWQELLLCTVCLKQFVHFHNDYVLPNHGIIQVEWIPGSLFAIDATVYKCIHGLDDRVFLYYEEQILGKKFLKLGYSMIIDTDISYLHNHSVSIDKSIKRYGKTAQLFQSRYYFYANYEQINFWQRFLMKALICYGLAARKILYNFFS